MAFPLMADTIFVEEKIAAIDTILSGQLTMSTCVREYEVAFAKKVGAPYAVMVNSGSSANLIALAALVNPLRSEKLRPNDEVLIPAVCWSTSLWPIIQMGLKPVFVDVDPATMNICVKDVRKRITSNTRAILTVHVLGNTCDMSDLMSVVDEHKLILVEDTCESLGSTYAGKTLGTFGAFGTYSFYFSHHITTGEGGMVVCQTPEDADLLKCLRAHGWSRELSNKSEVHAQYPHVDTRFCFVNMGYNVRPTEIAGAIGLKQLERLDGMNTHRKENRKRIIHRLTSDSRWSGQLRFPAAPSNSDPAWFGLACLLDPAYRHQLREFQAHLIAHGIENRPLISGNFARQPAIKMLDIVVDASSFPGADDVGECGFFIGIHASSLSEEQVALIVEGFLSFSFEKQAIKMIVKACSLHHIK